MKKEYLDDITEHVNYQDDIQDGKKKMEQS